MPAFGGGWLTIKAVTVFVVAIFCQQGIIVWMNL